MESGNRSVISPNTDLQQPPFRTKHICRPSDIPEVTVTSKPFSVLIVEVGKSLFYK